jgi:N-acetylglucosaminyl-diphospho-decaprenol L-rhamnosyltransferase
MPVFNRLEHTRQMITCLRTQVLDQPLRIVVVDDGSSDGTAAFLAAQPDVVTLKGDGQLWWAGGIQVGLDDVFASGANDDWVLFVNNDTEIPPGFTQILVNEAKAHGQVAMGSIIRDIDLPNRVLSLGARIDAWRFLVSDWLKPGDAAPAAARAVDALSGRGVLFPLAALRAVGGMRPRRLPHYFADYELSLRVRAAGWALLVSPRAAVYSREEYGNTYRPGSLRDRLLSPRSSSNVLALASFWWAASNWPQRLTMPLRVLLFVVFPQVRNKP